MVSVVRVEFGGPARTQYCPSPGYPLHAGESVVLETDWGVGMGDVGAILRAFPLNAPIRRILRKATPTDLSRRAGLVQREREARAYCRERIEARGLPMKLTEVRVGLDSSKTMVYFTADGRVDFRELVKDLTQHLRTRVELRQIGVRDEASVLGSAGPCGRPLCCRGFLQAFTPVSIRMAKDQNLALNPAKLSGMCGRLKCCLAYEHLLYADLKRGLPKVGCCVATTQGPGLVQVQNILEQTVLVGLETGGQVTLKAAEITLRPVPTPPGRGSHRGESSPDVPGGDPPRSRRPAGGESEAPPRTIPGTTAASVGRRETAPPDLATGEDS